MSNATSAPLGSAGLTLDGARPVFWRSPAAANLALAGLLWCWVFGELWFEWSVSEQYGYGLFVPFLGAYLLWLRVEDCPAPQPAGRARPLLRFLTLAALAQYPLAILYGANADWRPLAWGEALLAFGGTLWLLAHWGGRPWLRHFTPAFALFLFAIPWPSKWQSLLVNTLMNLVATVTVEALNWFGHPAVQHEHVIQLSQNVYVGIEEACSGVRSVQSTLMAGWLVGELWRYRPWGRVALMFWAAGVAVLFNLGRTLSLSLLAASRGAEVMEEYHDAAGYLVFGLSFATVLAGAWYARPRHKPAGPGGRNWPSSTMPAWLPVRPMLALMLVALSAWPVSVLWYAWRAPDVSGSARWNLNLATAVPEAVIKPPLKGLYQSLFYNEGEQAEWRDANGCKWLLYYFQWRSARAAQLGGVHVPEECLPAIGWTLEKQGPDLHWRREGVDLIFSTFAFLHASTRVFVFYGQWDPAGYPYHTKTGRFRLDRLQDAWQGDRKQDKQLLEVALYDAGTMEAATQAMEQFLDRAITVTPAAKMH